jgi:hypothetical protein
MRFLILLMLLAVGAAVVAYTPIGQVLGILAFIVGGLGLADTSLSLVLQGLFFAPYVVAAIFVAFVVADRVATHA